jgi:hypothetical protein
MIRTIWITVPAIAFSLALQGCAGLTTYNSERVYSSRSAAITFVDAKQRAIITSTPEEGKPTRVCAEPSPDALSTIAASQGVNLTKSGMTLGEAASLTEGAASIGLRTQSIQLMRDAMFRICEGYVSGALDQAAYETLYRRLQSSMVAILAIEQLTGTIKAQQVVLGGSAGTGNAQIVADLTAKSQQAMTVMRQAEAEADAAHAELTKRQATLAAATAILKAATDAKKDASEIATDKSAVDTATTAVTDQTTTSSDKDKAKADDEAAYKALDAARAASLTGSSSTTVTGSFGANASSTQTVTAVSTSVENIVTSTLGLNFTHELCTTVLEGAASKKFAPEVVSSCLKFLDESVRALQVAEQAEMDIHLRLQAEQAAPDPDPAPAPSQPGGIQAPKKKGSAKRKVVGEATQGKVTLAQQKAAFDELGRRTLNKNLSPEDRKLIEKHFENK